VQKYLKNLGTTSKFYSPGGDMKPVPHWGPTNIGRYITNCSHHGDLATAICVPLY